MATSLGGVTIENENDVNEVSSGKPEVQKGASFGRAILVEIINDARETRYVNRDLDHGEEYVRAGFHCRYRPQIFAEVLPSHRELNDVRTSVSNTLVLSWSVISNSGHS